jgi:hypothetical protein
LGFDRAGDRYSSRRRSSIGVSLDVRSAACSSSRVSRNRRRANLDVTSKPSEGRGRRRDCSLLALEPPHCLRFAEELVGYLRQALTDLAIKLRELRAVEVRMVREEKSRAAYLHGVDEHSRSTLGRPLTEDELERISVRVSEASG